MGVLGIVLASVFWGLTNRPVTLISDTSALIGVLTAKDRVLSKPKSAGFVARNWLQHDGDKRHQAVATERWVGLDEALTNQVISPNIGRLDWAHVVPKKTIPTIISCNLKQVFIASITLDLPETCLVLDASVFAETGSLKILYQAGFFKVRRAQNFNNGRLWNTSRNRKSKSARQTVAALTERLNRFGSIPPNALEP